MYRLRRLALSHRYLAAMLCVAALAMKLLVPSGYMVSSEHGRIAITLCSGMTPQDMTAQGMTAQAVAPQAIAMPGMHDDGAGSAMSHDRSTKHDKAEMPCAFSSLTAHALESVDLVLRIAAIAFAMALAWRYVRPLPRALTRYLRPPLRGPPAYL
ncbi:MULTISPECIES: hypothetical protein [unclassified Sphingomonas]|uniref:hypothetical protein n=1 Tax=unclassified Sphingomonas TaxID=196159 RepID=UPI001E5CD5D2|nr:MULTISPECIES: hypothetical protein [unclassified Sphingomonas]